MRNIDPNTGLYPTPENSFWRVLPFPTFTSDKRYKIVLIRTVEVSNGFFRRLFTGQKSHIEERTSENHWTLFYHGMNLRDASEEAWRYGQSRIKKSEEYQQQDRNVYLGDYPPKKYEGA